MELEKILLDILPQKIKPENYNKALKRVKKELKELKYYEIKTGIKIDEQFLNNPNTKFNKNIFIWYLLDKIDENPLDKELEYIKTEAKMPDIDIDIADEYRNQIIKDLENVYGKKKVAFISTFLTFSYKSALKDIFRVFGIPPGISNNITTKLTEDWENELKIFLKDEKLYPFLNKIISHFPNKYVTIDDIINNIIEITKDMLGQIRQQSLHASGFIISDEELDKHIPIKFLKENGFYATEWDLTNLEETNYLKIDLLGLRTLSIIQNTVNLIKQFENKDVNLENIDLNDPKMFENIFTNNLVNIFQIGTKGGQYTMKYITPKNFDDIVATTSLNRPGTKNLITEYVENKEKNIHSSIDKYIKKTNYVILFQEQINQIISDFLKIDEGEADLIRRKIEGIKDKKDVEKIKEIFYQKAPNNLVPEEIDFVFNYLIERAGYLFNKCFWEEQIIKDNIKIKKLKIGDEIESFNFLTNEKELDTIIDKWEGEEDIYEIEFENKVKHYVTLNHKYPIIIDDNVKYITLENIMHIMDIKPQQ